MEERTLIFGFLEGFLVLPHREGFYFEVPPAFLRRFLSSSTVPSSAWIFLFSWGRKKGKERFYKRSLTKQTKGVLLAVWVSNIKLDDRTTGLERSIMPFQSFICHTEKEGDRAKTMIDTLVSTTARITFVHERTHACINYKIARTFSYELVKHRKENLALAKRTKFFRGNFHVFCILSFFFFYHFSSLLNYTNSFLYRNLRQKLELKSSTKRKDFKIVNLIVH